MKTPHIHAAVIKAWADGAPIQHSTFEGGWTDVKNPCWNPLVKYRVKPEPKTDIIKYFHTNLMQDGDKVYVTPQFYSTHSNIKVVFDGETRELKSVELIKSSI